MAVTKTTNRQGELVEVTSGIDLDARIQQLIDEGWTREQVTAALSEVKGGLTNIKTSTGAMRDVENEEYLTRIHPDVEAALLRANFPEEKKGKAPTSTVSVNVPPATKAPGGTREQPSPTKLDAPSVELPLVDKIRALPEPPRSVETPDKTAVDKPVVDIPKVDARGDLQTSIQPVQETEQDSTIGEGEVFSGIQQEQAFTGLDQNQDLALPRSVEVSDAVAVPVAPDLDLGMSSLDTDFSLSIPDLDFNFTEEVKTSSAANEFGKIGEVLTGTSAESTASTLKSGDNTAVQEIASYVESQIQEYTFGELERNIRETATSEEAADLLREFQDKGQNQVNLATIRAMAVARLGDIQPQHTGRVTQHIVKNLILTQEISKRENEFSASYDFMDATWDFFEMLLPTGIAAEEIYKYIQTNSLEEVLDMIAAAPPEKQMEVLTAALDSWEKQETFLMGNNNSFFVNAQFHYLKDALLAGGRDMIEGNMTEAEKLSYFESALNGTFFAGEALALAKGIRGLIGFITRRIYSQEDAMFVEAARLFDPNRQFRSTPNNNLNVNEAFYQEFPAMVDRRQALAEAAKNKNTTLFRKTLEEEKRDLGNLEAQLLDETQVNKEARELSKNAKIKFKEARRLLMEERSRRLEEIKGRQAAVQRHIDEFDVAARAEAELSRISTFLRDGRMTEEELLAPTGGIVVRPSTRSTSHFMDSFFTENPTAKLRIEEEKGLRGVAEQTGLSLEELAVKQLPTPNASNEIGLPNPVSDLREMNDLMLTDADMTSLGMALAREQEKMAGTSLSPIVSGIGHRASDKEDSLGIFSVIFQDGAKPFKTAGEAKEAATRGLPGINTTVEKIDGGWGVRAEIEHYINPANDYAGLYLDPTLSTNAVQRATLPPSKRLSNEVLQGLWALKLKHRSFVQKMQKRFEKAVKGLSGPQGQQLQDALYKGERLEQEWLTEDEFIAATKIRDKEVFNAYTEMRAIYNQIYHLRNRVYHQKLRAENIKFVDDGVDGNLGKVLDPDEVDTADGLFYNRETGKLQEVSEATDLIFVRLTNPIKVLGDDGVELKREIIGVRPEQIKKLPELVLNKRVGHVDRFYRETGWVVKVDVEEVIDGAVVKRPRTTHILGDEKDARKIAEREGGVAERSRENDQVDRLFEDDSSTQFTYGSSHTRKKGERLMGGDGKEADIDNVFDAMDRALSSVQNSLDYNILRSLEARFYNEFAPFLRDGKNTVWDDNPSAMLGDSVKTASNKTLNDIKDWHSYIRSLRTHGKGATYEKIDALLDGVFSSMLRLPLGSNTQAAAMAARKLTADLVVVLNPLYQGLQNLVPAMHLSFAKGLPGVKSAFLDMPAIIAYTLTGNTKLLGLTLGSEDLAKSLIKELKNNGLVDAIVRSNDFLDMARGRVDVGGTSAARVGLQKTKRYTTGLIYRASLAASEGTIATMNILSYLVEFNKMKTASKGAFKFTAKDKARISFLAQKNNQGQNGLDMLSYQNPTDFKANMFQFFQHVNKIWLDHILAPHIKLISAPMQRIIKGKIENGRVLGTEVEPFAESWSQALMSTAIVYGAFGLAGGMGSSIGGWVEDTIRKNFPEFAESEGGQLFLDGAFDYILRESIEYYGGEGAVDMAMTYGPAAFIDMLKSFFLEGFPNINLLGVQGMVGSNIIESALSTYVIARYADIDTEDKAYLIASELAEPIRGFSGLEKAVLAYQFQTFPYSSRLSSNLRVTKSEAILMAANIQPDLVADYFNKSDFKDNSSFWDLFTDEGFAKKVTETCLQAMAREMSVMKMNGNLNFDTSLELIAKWSEIAQAATNEEFNTKVAGWFARKSLSDDSPLYSEYLKPYLGSTSGEAFELEALVQKANSEEARKVFEAEQELSKSRDVVRGVGE